MRLLLEDSGQFALCVQYACNHPDSNRLPSLREFHGGGGHQCWMDDVEESRAMAEMDAAQTARTAHERRSLTPSQQAAFEAFSKAVFADGALSSKTKQIIAVAVAHVTQCPYCIKGHTSAAMRAGATPNELMEAVWVAAEMRAGGAYAHSSLMLSTLAEAARK